MRGLPQLSQKTAPGEGWLPQAEQVAVKGLPHAAQNLAVARFSNWHFEQRICLPPGLWRGLTSRSTARALHALPCTACGGWFVNMPCSAPCQGKSGLPQSSEAL